MANRDKSLRLSMSASSSEIQLQGHGVPFVLDKELLALRSAKVAALLKKNPNDNLTHLFQQIPAGQEIIELVARFCHGFELNLSTENVIPLICLADYLEMTENHSNNNLLRKVLAFFEHRVLSNWSETIKALHSAISTPQHAVRLGLIDACLESLVSKALIDPRFLGEPIRNSKNEHDSENEDDGYRPNARRRLFACDWKSEDLTMLSLELYEPIVGAMSQHGVLPEYVAASVCQYAKKWVFSCGNNASIYKRSSQRDVIEAVERLLPRDKGLIPCTLLFEMLSRAISLDCNGDCRSGFEYRIGMQLDQATVRDLLIPSLGYAKELQYDIECVRRIVKHFYSNYSYPDTSGLISVAELIEEFFMKVSSDIDLKIETFVSLAEMSMAASLGIQRNSDGIYRAINIYLDKHRYLTEQEREEVCKVLDCHKMSPEACEHAAKNERLPMRFVVQVLFVAQLHLRDMVTKEMQVFDEELRKEDAEEEKENERKVGLVTEMEKMNIKVMELEQECYTIRKEIENGCRNSHKMIKGKINMWREMKRKLGCTSSIHDCNCQVKKKKKKKMHPK